MFLSAVVCSCIIFCYMNTLPSFFFFSLHLTLNASLDYMQLFFAIASSVAMNVLACDCWGPWSRVSLGLFLGLKVYTFSTCLDNAKLIFQRDSSFPSGPKPQSLLCSSSSSSRPIGKELFATGPERSLSACTAVTLTSGHRRWQVGLGNLGNLPWWLVWGLWITSITQRATQRGANCVDPKRPMKTKQMSGFNILPDVFLLRITEVLILLQLSRNGTKKKPH